MYIHAVLMSFIDRKNRNKECKQFWLNRKSVLFVSHALALIYQLAEKGDVAILESQVRKSPEVLREKDEYGAGPLHHAAAGGHVTLIQFIMSVDSEGNCKTLMDLGADPNILNKALQSPLHLAVSKRHNDLIELLLSYCVTNANLEGDLGNTALILACSVNNCEALNILIKNGAKLCRRNKLGHFPVHAAAFAGATKAMDVILKAGGETGHVAQQHINYIDKSKSSPLHLAVRGGNLETIRLCLETGAKVDQQQVHAAPSGLHSGAFDVVKLMLSSFDQMEDIINLTDGANQTPLHRATIFDHTKLAEYLISLGADLNSVDCKGNTPLLLATSCGSWNTVTLLLSKGSLLVTDRHGCNFLHLAILQPKGLKNLPEEVLQLDSVKTLLNCEDIEGCTPLHYACRLGIHDSVKNMLGLSGQSSLEYKSKDKKSALHFAAQYGRLNTCQRLVENLKDSRLLNEGDERGRTPLHLASVGGHTKVVQLLLRKGALLHCDYKGWTCLHHAASEGFTQTMDILLSAHIKLLDKTDEDGNTALHIAARLGHVAATKLLLARGAEIILNKNETSFLHEAVQNLKKEVVKAVIDSNRCSEALTMFNPVGIQQCVVLDMIEYLPECIKHLLDSCVKESDHDTNCPEFHIKYDFIWLQAPIEVRDKIRLPVGPLAAMNAMVRHNRIDLLNHPLCKKYLAMKWAAYGSIAHILNMFFYLLGLLPLTNLIVSLRPTYNNITATGERVITMKHVSFTEQSVHLSISMVMVVVMNIYSIFKELVQISQQGWCYFRDASNPCDWFTAIACLGFVIPMMLNVEGSVHWQIGAFAVLTGWMGFLIYLQRFEGFGIYIVMFGEIMKTLVRVIMVFSYLVLAFALGFHALMLTQKEFESISLSIVQTFVMMVGEMNYQNNFLEAYLKDELPFGILTYVMFISFVLLMPILLVNLMIGLAVGDIAEVQRNAALKRIAMQIDLHTCIEDKLPTWFLKRVDKSSTTVYPNRKCTKVIISSFQFNVKSQTCTYIENELRKQKYRMREVTSQLEKQHNLLKLIIQKMEISAEADEYDGPINLRGSQWPNLTQCKPKIQKESRWLQLLKAIEAKKD
uniref:Transient receptor potential cation channel, subfamily A, member 1b n=1 Tax=Neogobius melanostomus TaxID=47308 RepID=A0A8C6U7Q4_9GOBI